MLPLNAYVFKGRGHMLNWGVDFRGGSEILIEFSKPGRGGRRSARRWPTTGFHDADVVKYEDPTGEKQVELPGPRRRRLGRLRGSRPSRFASRCAKVGDATLQRLEWSEGGDKVYLRYDSRSSRRSLQNSLKAIGVSTDAGAAASAAPRTTPTR